MTWLLRNWHLKLGAVALATVLYTGFVFSGSFTEQTFPGVPVRAINQPDASYPLTQQLGSVDVRFRLAADAASRVTADSFAVTVDLSEYDMEMAPEPQALPINVRSLATGVTVLNYTPTTVAVAIDRIGQKEVPVVVERGDVPEGLSIGTPQVSDRTAIATGPESQLTRVERAVAQVQIFESGIDISRQVDLDAVDVDGRVLDLVELQPASVTVEIDVRAVQTSKTVPIRPLLSGAVPDGYEIVRVTSEPPVATLLGLPDALGPIEEVSTAALSVEGLTSTTDLEAELSLPDDTRLATGTEPTIVTVEIQPAIATRTLLLGVICQGAAADVACLPQQGQLAVTLRGPAATLAGLEPGDVTAVVDVAGLEPGDHDLAATVGLPNDVELVSISPATVPVTLRAPATPAPSPG